MLTTARQYGGGRLVLAALALIGSARCRETASARAARQPAAVPAGQKLTPARQ